jgi:putative PIN family toxin of toxin-antitoxin system
VKSSKSHRVVVDTNVLVSALVFGGNPRIVIELLTDSIIVVVSQEIITELRRIIHSKFPAFDEDLLRLEKLLERDAEVAVLGNLQVTVSRDPDDNAILETALAGNCQFVVSGDKDLLDIGSYQGIQIMSPTTFLQYIGQQH